jgi:Zn-dependent metalloprotease
MNPVVGLDVAGHEYSHLIIGRNGLGGLNYEAESGAINESIADMLGTAIEFYSGASPNWTIGEGIPTANILTPNPSPYMRNMSDPNNVNPGPQPDTYLGVNWVNTADTSDSNDYGGVHTNSGVGNYWFTCCHKAVQELMILEMPIMYPELQLKKQRKLSIEL